ncbi:MAG: protocatechuate 3,4-dioxygenase subunit beta [Gammaproteobacteria bacterium]|nr:protocatechuate 3,4-dioxygenase subunit beta [Gammaproteobacteria bacterium]
MSGESAGGRFLPRERDWHPPALAPDYRSSRLRSPRAPLLSLPSTLSEETGPVFGHVSIGELDHDLVHNYAAAGASALGPRILVHGYVRDQSGRPLPHTLVEIWQANAGGRYRHPNETYIAPLDPNFGGCGRCLTDADGHYRFQTIQPAPYPWPNGPNSWRPAHIHFSLFGEAFAQRLVTQMYFEGDPLIELCPIVQAIPRADAIDTLVARLDMDAALPMDMLAWRFDLVLRGRDQTYFDNRTEGL